MQSGDGIRRVVRADIDGHTVRQSPPRRVAPTCRPSGGRPPTPPPPASPLGDPLDPRLREDLGRDDYMPRALGGWWDKKQADWEVANGVE